MPLLVRAAALLSALAAIPAQAVPATSIPDLQAADGRFAARADRQADPADLRVTVWMLLALLGDGSTIRSGPNREPIKLAVTWLQRQQDGKGRIGCRPDAEWLLDHAMATYACCEVLFATKAPSARNRATIAIEALAQEVSRMRPGPDVELRLWCGMVQCAARQLRKDAAAADPTDPLAPFDRAVAGLIAALEGRGPTREPGPFTPVRARSAWALLRAIGPEPRYCERTPPWPDDAIADPLAAFYSATAAYLTGGRIWIEQSKRLKKDVADRQERTGEHAGTFAPRGAFGQQNGRTGTTAVAALNMEMYYRYSKLHLFE